jgi:serine/threonine protein kinase
VSEDLRQVQVGDFGLACCLVTHSNSSVIVYPSHQPGYAGTKLYAAPEQLRNICNPKVFI